MPDVSVIIPAFNRSKSINRAIESVLAQSLKQFELIIVDDGSTDDLATIARSSTDPRLRVVSHEKNRGPAAARNSGVAAARADFVAFLDSDDRWFPEKLERQLDFMRQSAPEVRASCTGYSILTRYSPRGELRKDKPLLRHRDLLGGCRVSPGSTLMVQKALFDEIGPFDEKLRRLEDWDWLLRLTARESLAVMPDILAEIDARAPRGPNFDQVKAAATVLKSRHFRQADCPRWVQRHFRGVLENELAATAYKNGHHRLALFHMLRSLWYFPYRSIDSVWRIVRAVLLDMFRGGRR